MLIHKLSSVIAQKISSELCLPVEKQQIIEYGAIGVLSQSLSILLLLATGYILGMLKEVIIVGFSSAVLRRYSGGAHCSSPLRCALLGVVMFPLMVLLARIFYSLSPQFHIAIIIISNISAIVIFMKHAPKDTPAKPIKNPNKIRKLKIKSIFVSSCIFIACIVLMLYDMRQASFLMALGSLNQAVTLTKAGHVYINNFDRALKHIV